MPKKTCQDAIHVNHKYAWDAVERWGGGLRHASNIDKDTVITVKERGWVRLVPLFTSRSSAVRLALVTIVFFFDLCYHFLSLRSLSTSSKVANFGVRIANPTYCSTQVDKTVSLLKLLPIQVRVHLVRSLPHPLYIRLL